jgi:hypothetical protein
MRKKGSYLTGRVVGHGDPPPVPVRGALEKLLGPGLQFRGEDRLLLLERPWFVSNEALQRLA